MGKLTGEVTPAYAILPEEKIKLINSWMPDVKIIFIMRDPVLRAWSQAKKSFFKFAGKSLEKASDDELITFFKLPEIVKRGDYITCFRNWTKFYDISQFLILFTEEISSNPIKVIKKAFLFLEVNPDIELDWDEVSKPVHVGSDIAIPDYVKSYLSNLFYPQKDQLESLIGRKVPWK